MTSDNAVMYLYIYFLTLDNAWLLTVAPSATSLWTFEAQSHPSIFAKHGVMLSPSHFYVMHQLGICPYAC